MENEEKNVFVLPVKKELIQVTKEVYYEFYKQRNHERYLIRKDIENGVVSYDSWKMKTRNGVDFLIDENSNVEHEIMKKNDLKKLNKCLKLLSKDELYLIHKIYVECKTEKEIGYLLKITHQAVNRRKKRLLKKLYNMLKDSVNLIY